MTFDPTADAMIAGTHEPPPVRERIAAHVLQLGALLVVLAAMTWKTFELDRFFAPKELVLHATALVVVLLCGRTIRSLSFTWVDRLLVAFLLLGIVSGVFAENRWLAIRAITITASGIALFWAARAIQARGYGRMVLNGVACATIAGAITSLLQTYGVQTDMFSINRAPGGTLGNRNFIAHLAAFGFPIVLLATLRARNFISYIICAGCVALVLATLVLTRSRAAWLAFAVAMIIFLLAFIASRAIRTSGTTWMRLLGIFALAAAGIAAALVVPNRLRWNSDSPYRDSMRDVANFQEGSGRGRMIQYKQSLRMTRDHILLGVGPGNWSVDYPEHAARSDPSLNNSEQGTTANPWPSSDWVAFLSERGPLATLLLLLACAGIAFGALRSLIASTTADDALAAAALLASLAATAVAGAFDAVLLLALPTLLVWSTAGAVWSTARPTALSSKFQRAAFTGVTVICIIAVVRSSMHLTAMGIYSNSSTTAAARTAARIDPGSYRAHIRLARNGRNRAERCDHARAARELFPNAAAAKSLSRGC